MLISNVRPMRNLFGILFLTLLTSCTQVEVPSFQRSEEETIRYMEQADLWITASQIAAQPDQYQLIDLRPAADFSGGHREGALHVPLEKLLDPANQALWKDSKKELVLYAANSEEAVAPAMLLVQLGVEQVHILLTHEEGDTKSALTFLPDEERMDFNLLYREAVEKHQQAIEAGRVVPPPPPQRSITRKKKSPPAEEDGC